MKLINKILLLLLVLFIPIFTCFVLVITDIGNELAQKNMSALEDKTESVYNEINKTFEDLYCMNARFLEEENIRLLSFVKKENDLYGYMRLVNNVRSQLSIIEDLSDYISDVSIYYKNNYIKINAKGSKEGSYTLISETEYNQLMFSIKENAIVEYQKNDSKILSIFLKPLLGNYIIELKLDQAVVKGILDNYFSEKYYLSVGNTHITNMSEEDLKYQSTYLSMKNKKITVDGIRYYLCSKGGGFSGTKLVTLYDIKGQLQYIQRVDFVIACLVVITFLMMTFFIQRIFVLIHKPLKDMNQAFLRLETGDFTVRVKNPTSKDFNYLYKGFNSMVIETKKHIDKEIEQQNLLNRAELKQLQAQINPHFFYNSFFMLKRMIVSGLDDEAAMLSNLLGEYFEYLTRNSEDLVPLAKEYHYCRIYTDIQKMRFENRIQIEMEELAKEDEMVLVPKLVLQPIIENSFKYGLKNLVSNGILRIQILSNAEEVIIKVEDNGEELTDEKLIDLQQKLAHISLDKSVEMTGLFNIHRRVQLLTDSKGGITFERASLGGLCTSIKLMRRLGEQTFGEKEKKADENRKA